MRWNKHKVELFQLDKFCKTYMAIANSGNPDLEHMYCIFQYKESSIPQIRQIFDFINLCNNNTVTQENISILYTYQPSNG